MHKYKFSLFFTPLDVHLTKVMDLCGSFIPKYPKPAEFNSREEESSLSNKLKKGRNVQILGLFNPVPQED